MGRHILKCECGKEHDISEMFGRVVMERFNIKEEDLIKDDNETDMGNGTSLPTGEER